jgi:hypothetical protein
VIDPAAPFCINPPPRHLHHRHPKAAKKILRIGAFNIPMFGTTRRPNRSPEA